MKTGEQLIFYYGVVSCTLEKFIEIARVFPTLRSQRDSDQWPNTSTIDFLIVITIVAYGFTTTIRPGHWIWVGTRETLTFCTPVVVWPFLPYLLFTCFVNLMSSEAAHWVLSVHETESVVISLQKDDDGGYCTSFRMLVFYTILMAIKRLQDFTRSGANTSNGALNGELWVHHNQYVCSLFRFVYIIICSMTLSTCEMYVHSVRSAVVAHNYVV